MKIKTSELTGEALNWAVQKAERPGKRMLSPIDYCGKWKFGGPIIEREKIDIGIDDWNWKGRPKDSPWVAAHSLMREAMEEDIPSFGPTPLIAAMRCLVASKLGDVVDIPAEI